MAHSGIIFDPDIGMHSPDTEVIREGVAQDWANAFYDPDCPPLDTDPATPAGQLIDAETAEIEAKNAEVIFLASMFNPNVSEGRWQDALGYIYFLTRHVAEPTVVTCQLTGLNGTSVPYGALATSTDGWTLICNSAASIGADGTAQTTFRVSQTGPIPISAHSVTSIITTIPGWDTIDNSAAGAIGRDLETRFEFESRRAKSVAANARGSVGAIYGTIANLPGVLDCQVLENIGPDPVVKFGVTVPGHGVVVCVYGGEDTAIAEWIYRKKDNGCDTGGNTSVSYTPPEIPGGPVYTYLILRPAPINFWVKITLGAGSTPTPAQIEALKKAIFDDFYGLNTNSGNARIGMASTVYASRFYCPAVAVDGIKNIQSIDIALSQGTPSAYSDLVTINGDQEPVMSTDNITVAIA